MKIVEMIGDKEEANRLELVIVELHQCYFLWDRNEIPDRKETWEHDFVLTEDEAIRLQSQGQQHGFNCDVGGRLKKPMCFTGLTVEFP